MRLSLIITILPIIAFAQDNRGHNWILGYTQNAFASPSGQNFGGMQIQFSGDTLTVDTIDIYCGTPTGVANDEEGNLLFYTSGCSIFDKNHQIMLNGDDIHNGENSLCNPSDYVPGDAAVKSGTVILPLPGSDDKYKVFYLRIESNIYSKLLYCDVDMGANNGLGAVIQKGVLVLEDSLVDAISAVKHGNGTDWWILLPRGVNEAYWTVLLTSSGIQTPDLQAIPNAYTPFTYTYLQEVPEPPYLVETLLEEYNYECNASQSCFSHDGRQYFRLVKGQEVLIYDFDRCTGGLNLKRSVPIPLFNYPQPYRYAGAGGMAVSPNNNYLYFHNNMQLFQLDISPDSLFFPEPFLVGEYDGFYQDLTVFSATFFQMRNAPDGKIYITSGNTMRVLHVIHQPDSTGLTCNLSNMDWHYRGGLPGF